MLTRRLYFCINSVDTKLVLAPESTNNDIGCEFSVPWSFISFLGCDLLCSTKLHDSNDFKLTMDAVVGFDVVDDDSDVIDSFLVIRVDSVDSGGSLSSEDSFLVILVDSVGSVDSLVSVLFRCTRLICPTLTVGLLCFLMVD